MDGERSVQVQWFLSLVVAILALVAGAKTLLRKPAETKPEGSRLLREETMPQSGYDQKAVSTPETKAAPAVESVEARCAAPVESQGRPRFRLTPKDLLSSAGDDGSTGKLWEVRSAKDAANLLAGCPMDTIIACSFHRAYAEHGGAQDRAMRQLAEAQPAGMVFALVDMTRASDVADWASVKDPEVRLLEPDGVVLERLSPQAVASGALHRTALAKSEQLAQEGKRKLEELGRRFPGALHDQLGMCLPRDSVEKMKAAATELVGTGEDEMLEKLCRCISQSAAPPKPRHVVSLAKVIRTVGDAKAVLPLLDLSRRLASEKLLGGQEPGATEALELLLNAILMKLEMEEPGAPFMLALQVLANCFQQAVVGEALLPVVVEMMTMPVWQALWLSSRQPDKPLDRARDAAATLLLNASVMLRGAKLRASHRPLLRHSIAALKVMPQDERVNWAVGNLLAMGGGPDDAKETLQAQPRSSLRMLAAAIFHGQLDGPEGAAFPDVWHPPDSGAPPGGAPGGGPGDPGRRPRAPIPGRYRRRGGG